LKFLSQAVEHNNRSNIVIVFQQHPGAKQKNLDITLLQNWIDTHKDFNNDLQIIFSDKSTKEMLVIADSALYYQTSMGPLFALAGIPSIQVGHKVYEDILVKEGLCFVVTHVDQWFSAISKIKIAASLEEEKASILYSLGIRPDWKDTLLKFCN